MKKKCQEQADHIDHLKFQLEMRENQIDRGNSGYRELCCSYDHLVRCYTELQERLRRKEAEIWERYAHNQYLLSKHQQLIDSLKKPNAERCQDLEAGQGDGLVESEGVEDTEDQDDVHLKLLAESGKQKEIEEIAVLSKHCDLPVIPNINIESSDGQTEATYSGDNVSKESLPSATHNLELKEVLDSASNGDNCGKSGLQCDANFEVLCAPYAMEAPSVASASVDSSTSGQFPVSSHVAKLSAAIQGSGAVFINDNRAIGKQTSFFEEFFGKGSSSFDFLSPTQVEDSDAKQPAGNGMCPLEAQNIFHVGGFCDTEAMESGGCAEAKGPEDENRAETTFMSYAINDGEYKCVCN